MSWFGNKIKHSLASKGIKTINKFVNPEKKKVNLNNIHNAKIGDVVSEDIIYQYVQKMHSSKTDWGDGDLGERIEEFQKYELRKVKVDDIYKSDFYIDDEKMLGYYDKIIKTGKCPAIVLKEYDLEDKKVEYKKESRYGIIDGTHRAIAMEMCDYAKCEYMLAWVGVNKK